MIRLSDREAQKLGDRLGNAPLLPPLAADAASDFPETVRPTEPDDATAAYVEKMRMPFELLRQAEAQLGGLLVLATASGQAIAGHPMLELASDAVGDAESDVHSIKVPPCARHHHHHLMQAMRAITSAVTNARRILRPRDDPAIDAVLVPLRAAHQHLLWATSALPGFEVVALSQACCANHTPMTNRSSR